MFEKRPVVLLLLGLSLTSLGCGAVSRLLAPDRRSSGPTAEPAAPTPLVTPTLNDQHQTPPATDSSEPQAAATTATAAGTLDQGWQVKRDGLEKRLIYLPGDEGGVQETLYILRIDPALYEFDVGYKPGEPQRLMDWQSETGALIVVNGGYFTPEQQATGLIIVDGQAFGTSYADFGGMLAISDAGPELRSLRHQPYDPYEPLRAAVQSFPILVTPEGQVGYAQEDGLADRRTVIAQDRQGRMLFILAITGTLTLHEMSRYLVESDLELVLALNLDGGASTGLQLADPPEGVAPFSLLPIVITVRPKG